MRLNFLEFSGGSIFCHILLILYVEHRPATGSSLAARPEPASRLCFPAFPHHGLIDLHESVQPVSFFFLDAIGTVL